MLFSNPKRQLEKYFARHPGVKVIVVAGDFGRTSALRALEHILGQEFVVSVGVNRHAEEAPDIVLLDFMSSFNFPNITPDFTIVTALRDVSQAGPIFDIANRSRHILINRNDIPQEGSEFITNPNIITYGDELPADYYFENLNADIYGQTGNFIFPGGDRLPAHVKLLGEHNLRPVTMAVAVAHLFELPHDKIIAGVEALRPLPGHLSPGKGINDSIIIDDSADTSLLSVELALKTIYALETPSRILVTGKFDPAITVDKNLMSEVLILDPKAPKQSDPIFHIFHSELDLLQHLATRQEPDGVILLEYSLPNLTTSQIL